MVTSHVNKKEKIDPIVSQVLDILGIKKNTFESVEGTFRDNIDVIIAGTPEAKTNKKLALYLINEVDVKYFHTFQSLHGDKQVALAALKQDSNVFFRLKWELQKQTQFWEETLKSFVREKTGFIEIEKFLSKYFSDEWIFEKLFSFYKKYLQKAQYFFSWDIEKQLISLREKHSSLYTLIFKKKFLEQEGKKIILWKWFLEDFSQSIEWLPENLSPKEKKMKYIEIIQGFLNMKNSDITEDIMMFFESVLSLICIKKQKPQKGDDLEDQDEEIIYDDPTQETEDRLEFCVPQCNYSLTDSWDCDLMLWANIHMRLPKQEFESMTDRSLKNYVRWVMKLTQLWLWFALKHEQQFFSICDVDPFSGEWLSEWKLLKILNKVWKKIWVPEKNFQEIDKEGNEVKKEVWCFQRLDEAVYQFRQIASTGKVYEKHICDPSKKWSKSIAQIALEQKWYFSSEWKGFQRISQW